MPVALRHFGSVWCVITRRWNHSSLFLIQTLSNGTSLGEALVARGGLDESLSLCLAGCAVKVPTSWSDLVELQTRKCCVPAEGNAKAEEAWSEQTGGIRQL